MKWILFVLIGMVALASYGAAGEETAVQGSVQLTVYNDDFALVSDVRSLKLAQGVNIIEIEDVAARIDPTSVLFSSITAPNSVTILEQNYQYDLISPENILNKSVGEKVFYSYHDGSGNLRTQTGVLLNPPKNGGTVIRTDDGGIILNPPGTIMLGNMPEGLHPRPTLSWMLRSDKAGDQEAEISYITSGINWRSDYVVLVSKNDDALDLAGWVTLTNNSGATYNDAKLTLMAGDVKRVRDEMKAGRYREAMPMMADAAPQFEEKSFFEYHIYKMARSTTIRNSEIKQLSLLNASNVPVKKELIYDGRGDWWRNWWYPGRTELDPGSGWDTSNYHKVNVVLEVKNSKENHMGMPLPKGKVRVYKLDDDGSRQFIGEDMIDHTPRDEKIRLYIGDSFDVVGDYKRTDYQRISKRVVEESFEVEVRNHKDTPADVKIIEHVWGDWKMVAKSHDFTKKDAHTIEFPVRVPKDGKVTVTYTVRTTW